MPQGQARFWVKQSKQTKPQFTQLSFQIDAISVNAEANDAPRMAGPQVRGGLPPRTLRLIREYIDANLGKSVCLDELARLARLSKYHFARSFKQSAGVTPHAYLIKRRVDRARELLSDMSMPLAEVALSAGFSNQSHFTCRFREQIGMTPSSYRWNLP